MQTRPLAATLLLLMICCVPALSGCTPKLGEEHAYADLQTKADLDGKYVTTTGVVRLAVGIAQSTSCNRSSCNIDLWPEGEPNGNTRTVALEMSVGSGENEMAELPDTYKREDLKVKAMGGKELHHGDKVKVSGKVKCKLGDEPSLPCRMRVDRVDAP